MCYLGQTQGFRYSNKYQETAKLSPSSLSVNFMQMFTCPAFPDHVSTHFNLRTQAGARL